MSACLPSRSRGARSSFTCVAGSTLIVWAWMNAAYAVRRHRRLADHSRHRHCSSRSTWRRRSRRGRLRAPFADLGANGVLIAPSLLSAFPALASVEPRWADPALLFAVLFGLLAATAWTPWPPGAAAAFHRRLLRAGHRGRVVGPVLHAGAPAGGAGA